MISIALEQLQSGFVWRIARRVVGYSIQAAAIDVGWCLKLKLKHCRQIHIISTDELQYIAIKSEYC